MILNIMNMILCKSDLVVVVASDSRKDPALAAPSYSTQKQMPLFLMQEPCNTAVTTIVTIKVHTLGWDAGAGSIAW